MMVDGKGTPGVQRPLMWKFISQNYGSVDLCLAARKVPRTKFGCQVLIHSGLEVAKPPE